jgi:gliding motility-associated-like protein
MEEIIRESLGEYEMPYNPKHWSEMEQMLDKTFPATKPKADLKWLKIAGAGAGVIAASYVLYLCLNNSAPININKENSLTTEEIANIISNKNENVLINEANSKEFNNEEASERNKSEQNITINNSSENNTETTLQTNSSNENTQTSIVNKDKLELPNISFAVNNTSGCGKINVLFTPDKKDLELNYFWNFGDGNTSDEVVASHTYTEPGEYKATLTIGDKKGNTERKSIENDYDLLKYPYIEYVAVQKDATQYNWSLDGKTLGSSTSGKTIIKNKGSYTITLAISDKNGCKTTKNQIINITKDFSLFAPNAFTPNGDGINDEFIPEAIKAYNIDYSMKIIDSKNHVVFISSSNNKEWNGKLHNTGNQLEEGTYIWMVETKDANGNIHSWKGQILLQR